LKFKLNQPTPAVSMMLANGTAANVALVKLESVVGKGATGLVWKASSDIKGTGSFIALKQSRAPLRLKKPLIVHEACILRHLQGHVSIPKFYAYHRQEHFEFLALELLGSDLTHLLKYHDGKFVLSTVLKIADQMLSALSYIHGQGIVHRDVKPCNILLSLENPEQLMIVDFAFARRVDPCEFKKSDAGVVGTLTWASIRSHEGYQLTRRDDLESLALVLLSFIRGGLPWVHYNEYFVLNPMGQVLHKKRGWPGDRLGAGHPHCFGKFLDYARNLTFEQIPDYHYWTQVFNDLAESRGFDLNRPFDWTVEERDPERFLYDEFPEYLDPPVETGQLVYFQILARPTLEAFGLIIEDPSYWHDPELSTDPLILRMNPIPGIVVHLDRALDRDARMTPRACVLPIRRGQPPEFMQELVARIVSDKSLKVEDYDIVLPGWPFDDTYCFGWPYPTEFVPPHWKISPEAAEELYDFFYWDNTGPMYRSPDDRYGYERLARLHNTYTFAQPYSLGPNTLENCGDLTPNWTAEKGWFDDLERICKMYGKKNRCPWPWDPEVIQRHRTRHQLNSYDHDLSTWADVGQWEDRDCSLALPENVEADVHREVHKTQLVVKGLPAPYNMNGR
ncbi:hypothetical protein H0H93_009045, partial [Arthromyces matolae]